MRVHVTEEDRPINPAVEFEVAPASEVEAALARLHAESVLAPGQGLVHHAYGGRGVRPQVHRPHLWGRPMSTCAAHFSNISSQN